MSRVKEWDETDGREEVLVLDWSLFYADCCFCGMLENCVGGGSVRGVGAGKSRPSAMRTIGVVSMYMSDEQNWLCLGHFGVEGLPLPRVNTAPSNTDCSVAECSRSPVTGTCLSGLRSFGRDDIISELLFATFPAADSN
jgi:hypothetical protein